MRQSTKQILTALSAISLVAAISGCSIFISKPRVAKINIQGLDNKHYEYIVTLDEPVADTNLDIQISKHYTVQIDFEWLWNSGADNLSGFGATNEDMIPPLVPWMLCKYRF